MANARKPDNVHLLRGTHRPDRHGDPDSKPKIEAKIPAAPKWLGKVACDEWRRICKVLENTKLLTEADTTVLAQYCLLYSELKEWKQDFPAAKHTQLRLCLVELGLTPKARSQITVGKPSESNPFDNV